MRYPMLMEPIFKDYLWGGSRLADKLGKQTSIRPLAESWEISCHPDGLSKIANGLYKGRSLAAVLQEHPHWLSKNNISGFDLSISELPILVKLIDAKDKLSLQVHPDDDWSFQHEGQPGKNEMWYVMDAEPDAELILGLHDGVSRDTLLKHIKENSILDIVRRVKVKTGDCYCIPAGLIHGIGTGVLVAEVQQSSNVTYRVYDYDRRDAAGALRPLHTKQAAEVINPDLRAQKCVMNMGMDDLGIHVKTLTNWRYFKAHLLDIQNRSYAMSAENTFAGLLVLSGSCWLEHAQVKLPLKTGDSVFLPAGLESCMLSGYCQLMQIGI